MRAHTRMIVFGILSQGGGRAVAEDARINIGSAEQQAVFIAGAAQAFTLVNLQTQLSGEPPLYCAPAGHVLNVAEMYRLASQTLTGPHEPQTFLIATLDSLRADFPCK